MSRRPLLIQAIKVDAAARGRWARLALRGATPSRASMLYATLHDERGAPLNGHLYLRSASLLQPGTPLLTFFVPETATELRLFSMGPQAEAMRQGRLSFRTMSRAWASAHLLLASPQRTLRCLMQSVPVRSGVARGRVRQILATLAFEAQNPQQDYTTWLALFDHWSAEDFPPQLARTPIAYLVLSRERTSEPLAATLQSLYAQWGSPGFTVLVAGSGRTPHQAAEELSADYVGILQAGEILPPHATYLAAEQLAYLGNPEIAIVDEDEVSLEGVRHAPRFKPEPNQMMILSGELSRGLWLVQRLVLLRYAPRATEWAEALRLAIWFARRRTGSPACGKRIPFLLTHRRPDTESAPPAVLAALVEQQLQGGGPRITPVPTRPLSFRMRDHAVEDRITIIVPSTLRQQHSLSCIRAILEGTDYPRYDLHVAVMQPGSMDAGQRANTKVLEQYPDVSVTLIEAPSFNFSEVNNQIAARTAGEHILLLNDDVSPIRRDWLRWMAAFLRDPQVGIVGARLLYPNQRVQHGGVIMGLSGLCDHAHRYLPASESGYMSRAVIVQELSAVTAACMLVRRRLFEQVGGLDESYPSAFNDVDFALRVGRTGHSVVYAPQAELHHHELQTYGSHYAGERQRYETEEVRRMQREWAGVCAVDPFHNPNLSLAGGMEWQLAFPPRITIDRTWQAGGAPVLRWTEGQPALNASAE